MQPRQANFNYPNAACIKVAHAMLEGRVAA